jgi:hypothetical protein
MISILFPKNKKKPMNKIKLKIYQNIFEKSDGTGLDGYYGIKVNDQWICGEKFSPINKIPIASQFKSDLSSIISLLEVVTGKKVEIEWGKW